MIFADEVREAVEEYYKAKPISETFAELAKLTGEYYKNWHPEPEDVAEQSRRLMIKHENLHFGR